MIFAAFLHFMKTWSFPLISNSCRIKRCNVKRLTAIELSLITSKNLSSTSWLISLLAIKWHSNDLLFWSSTVATSLQPAVSLHFSKHSVINAVLNVSKTFLWETLDGVLTKNSAMERFTFNKNKIIDITIPFILKKACLKSTLSISQ